MFLSLVNSNTRILNIVYYDDFLLSVIFPCIDEEKYFMCRHLNILYHYYYGIWGLITFFVEGF